MKTINLIHPGESECQYEVITFPDGELHLKFNEELNRKDEYMVLCRITNSDELFLLMQAANILNNIDVLWELRILYLMGMRMDRIISFREPFTLKVLTNIINALGATNVTVFHPHSDRTLYELKNCTTCDGYSNELHGVENGIYNPTIPNTAICYPDAGAKRRYLIECGFEYKDAQYKPDVITLKKERDLDTGAIKSIVFDEGANHVFDENYNFKQYDAITVVDDLCDAGGTFVGAAKLLRDNFPNAQLNIFVRHMVNPKGIINLSENYDHVFFTNSYRDWDMLLFQLGAMSKPLPNNVSVIDIVSDLAKV